MMKALRNFFYLLLITVSLAACSGSKRMVKKATKFEESGMYTEAARFYMEALRRKNDNVDARIGLQSSGQRVLDDLFQNFFKAQTSGDHKRVVYDYKKAKDFYNEVARFNVELDYPSYYDDYYSESKDIYIENTYEKANKHFYNKAFAEAEKLYEEVLRLDRNYKEASARLTVSKAEPLYVRGIAAFDAGEYRTAYTLFEEVLSHDNGYKDALERKEESLSLGRFTIGMLPFKNLTYNRNAEDRVAAYFMNEIVNSRNPFIKVVDREHTAHILSEQKNGLSGVYDESTAVEAGKLLGVKAVLTGKLITYDRNEGREKSTSYQAKESYRVKIYVDSTDSYTYQTRYRTARYFEKEKRNAVMVSFQYSLISTETGEILFSDLVEKHYEDEVNYATSNSNYQNLYPVYKGAIQTGSAKRNLDRLFTSKKDIESVESLSQKAFKSIAQEMVRKVLYYEKSRS